MKKKDIVYELECWITRNDDNVVIHHTNNGGFPAPGQLGSSLDVHPAKLIVYKNGRQRLEENGIKI